MRGLGRNAGLSAIVGLVGLVALPARTAAADTMDPALARLVTDTNCRVNGKNGAVYYNPTSKFTPCGTNDVQFAQLIAQYGAAVAPTVMHSARTTGFGGFELSFEGAYTTIDNNAQYWIKGTQGPQDPTTKLFSTSNTSPPGVLQLYQLKFAKGFPLGFEIAAAFGYLAQTSMYTIGADVRWSIFEGFRTGVPAFFPELAVGGGVRTVTGTDQFQLTVASADVELSKPIPIAGTVVLTPFVGYQYLRIFGDSSSIDLTPNTDATNYCGYQGTRTPYSTAAGGKAAGQVADGQPICSGSSADYNNTVVFAPARLNRHRMFGGVQLRVQMIRIGGQFMYDLVDPGQATTSGQIDGDTLVNNYHNVNPYEGVKRQMTLSFDVAAVF